MRASPFQASPLARRLLLASAIVALGACERKPAAPSAESARAAGDSTAPATATPTGAGIGWSPEAGPVLLVQDESGPLRALVVFPDFTDSTLTDTTTFDLAPVRGMTADLFSRGGVVSRGATLAPASENEHDDGCTGWPPARVAAPGGAAPAAWTIGFVAGRAQPLALDSLAGMATRDSARFAADVARLASGLPDGGGSEFRGLPYVVRSAYRFTIAPGTEGLVADLMRRVNQEANPRMEHLLLVGEREGGDRWQPAYHERTAGAEETLEVSDILGGVIVGDPARPTLVMARDYGDGTAYALLERTGPRSWRVRWSSAYAGC